MARSLCTAVFEKPWQQTQHAPCVLRGDCAYQTSSKISRELRTGPCLAGPDSEPKKSTSPDAAKREKSKEIWCRRRVRVNIGGNTFLCFSGVHEGSCISTLGVMSSADSLPGTTRRFILHMSLRLSLSVRTNFLAIHCQHKCGKRSESVRCFERADSGPISRTSMTPHRVLEAFFRMRCKFPYVNSVFIIFVQGLLIFIRLCFGTPHQLAKVLHIGFICKEGASKIQCAFNAFGLFCLAQSNEYQRFWERFNSSLFQRLWIKVEFHFTGNGKKVGSILLVPRCHMNRLNVAVGHKIPQTRKRTNGFLPTARDI